MANKNKTYTQCLLKNNNLEQIAWIPTEFVELNHTIKIDNYVGEWEIFGIFKTVHYSEAIDKSHEHTVFPTHKK